MSLIDESFIWSRQRLSCTLKLLQQARKSDDFIDDGQELQREDMEKVVTWFRWKLGFPGPLRARCAEVTKST